MPGDCVLKPGNEEGATQRPTEMQKPSALPADWAPSTVRSIQLRDLEAGWPALSCGWGLQALEEQGPPGSPAERLAAAVSAALCPQEHRGLLSIRYPMEHGIVKDWNDMERIWQYVYSKDQLQTFSEEVRVLCSGAPAGCAEQAEPLPQR